MFPAPAIVPFLQFGLLSVSNVSPQVKVGVDIVQGADVASRATGKGAMGVIAALTPLGWTLAAVRCPSHPKYLRNDRLIPDLILRYTGDRHS